MSIFPDNLSPPHIVVIGGGATGTGIARDAAARGLKVTVVERENLGSGTSGSFHGMLHSGARYAVNDLAVAADCYQENQRLRALIPSAITETGGMFVALTRQEAAHADVILQACENAGIPTREITATQALDAEPQLTHRVRRAFLVPDGFIDGAEVIRLNRQVAEQAATAATFLEQHEVTGFVKNNGRIGSVSVKNTHTGVASEIPADYVINAAGVWSGKVAKLADAPFEMIYDKGTMIAFRERLTKRVLNRCRPEDDGDLLVSSATHSIMGTTARIIDNPDACLPTQEEADALMAEGAALVPRLQQATVEKIYAGVRPLLKDNDAVATATRSISRSFRIIDHADDGLDNFISIIGGKVTLYRRMAEDAVDVIAQKHAQ